MTWEHPGHPTLQGFRLYQDGVPLAEVGKNVRSWTGDLESGHCWTVRAFGSGGESEDSNEVCGAKPDKPSLEVK